MTDPTSFHDAVIAAKAAYVEAYDTLIVALNAAHTTSCDAALGRLTPSHDGLISAFDAAILDSFNDSSAP
jgi:hypothetical protein